MHHTPPCARFLLSWLLLVLATNLAAAASYYTGEAGVIIAQNDQASARVRALEGAFRDALEKVVAEQLDAEKIVAGHQALEARFYARPLSYILSYRVLWEYPDVPYYRVRIEAEIARGSMRQALANLGFLPLPPSPPPPAEAAGKAEAPETPLVWLLVAERRFGQATPTWQGEQGIVPAALQTRLQSRGIRVSKPASTFAWDGQEASALAAARQAGAKVLLVGTASVQQTYSAVAGTTVQGLASVQALEVESGRSLAREHVETTVLHDDPVQAGDLALKQAAASLATRLATPLLAYGRDQAAQVSPAPRLD